MTFNWRTVAGIISVGTFLGLLVIGPALAYLSRPQPFQISYPTTDVLDTGAYCVYAWANQAISIEKFGDACPPRREVVPR